MEDKDLVASHIRVDGERCVACRECMEICPQTRGAQYPVYEWGEEGMPRVANPESCIRCLSCELGCRARAIAVEVEDDGSRRPGGDPRAEMKCRAIF